MAGFFASFPSGGSVSGVVSLNGLTGALTLVGGTDITITPSGTNITIASTGANTALSNLTNPTALNQDLNMGTHDILGAGAVSIGTSAIVGKLNVYNAIAEGATPAISFRITDSPTFGYDFFHDTGNTGDFIFDKIVSGSSSEVMRFKRDGDTVFTGNVLPASNVSFSLGGSGQAWNQIYGTTILDQNTNPSIDIIDRELLDTGGGLQLTWSTSGVSIPGAAVLGGAQKVATRIPIGPVTVSPTTDYIIILNDVTGSTITLPAGVNGMTFIFAATSNATTNWTWIPNGSDTVDALVAAGPGQGGAAVHIQLAFNSGVWYGISAS